MNPNQQSFSQNYGRIFLDKDRFINQQNIQILLRGVNFSGSSKVPFQPIGATHLPLDYDNYRQVTFVGRPAPLAEADEHFRRLRAWGFNFLRWIVTWEAVEHDGPGQYDESYLDYLRQMVQKAGQYGFYIWIDPHQDVWSRFTGGDGAPGWIFEMLDMDMRLFGRTGTAYIHNDYPHYYPHMIWPLNYTKLTVATMFTIFFGAKDFAPGWNINGQSVQHWLQERYIQYMEQIAKRLADLDHVVGYGSMNEPFSGYISRTNLDQWEVPIKLGPFSTPVQNMALGSGWSTQTPFYVKTPIGFKYFRNVLLNPKNESIWINGRVCPWREQGVWDFDSQGQPAILDQDFFTHRKNPANDNQLTKIDFWKDYLKPFINVFAQRIRQIDPKAIIFVEGEPQPDRHDLLEWSKSDADNIVNSSHFYDGKLLFTKTYHEHFTLDSEDGKNLIPIIGKKNVQKFYDRYLKKLKNISTRQMNGVPTVIGEFGIPFDFNNKIGLKTGNYEMHEQAIANYYQALDKNLLNSTQWNYTSDNNHDYGDLWNFEDLSIFSLDDKKENKRNNPQNAEEYNNGGRSIKGFARPYIKSAPGEISAINFITKGFFTKKNIFTGQIKPMSCSTQPAIVYVPLIQFPTGYAITHCDGSYQIQKYTDGYHEILWYPKTNMPIAKIQIQSTSNESSELF